MSAISVGNLLTVHRLQGRAMPLCPDAGLLPPRPPLWYALAASLAGEGAAVVTCVATQPSAADGGRGFVQLRQLRQRQSAEMLYIAPAPYEDEVPRVWDALLTRVAHWSVRQGVVRVLAAVPADGPAEIAFRRNGYLRYAADTLYERRFPDEAGAPGLDLRPSRPVDRWGLQQLHVAATPLRVQQAAGLVPAGQDCGSETGAPASWTVDLVLEDAAGVAAALQLRKGASAHWIRLELRPDAESLAAPLIQEALARIAHWPARPVRCSVRQYQALLSAALVDCGFTAGADRALLARHSVLPVRPALEEAVQRLPGALNSLNPTLPEPSNSMEGRRLATGSVRSTPEWRYDRSPNN